MAWLPLLGSFAIYLTPLVGPHAVWLLGESLLQELTQSENRDPSWIATDIAVALTAQVGVGLLLAWSRRSAGRLLTWIPVIPALVIGLNTAYLLAIPSHFLIEPDTAPEITTWSERCFVREASLLSVRTTVNQPVGGARAWWLQRPDGRYALLQLPACTVADATLPTDFLLGFQFATATGTATLERTVPTSSTQTWWLLGEPAAPLASILKPEEAEGAPILSDAGDAVAWVQKVAGSGPPVLERLLIRALHESAIAPDVVVELAPFGAGRYTLTAVDTQKREALVWRNERPLLIGFDGRGRDLSFDPSNIRPQASTYLRHRDGWVAWDAYKENGPYELRWALPAGSGLHRTNKGRSITSAAVDPSGSLIAITETTTLNIGDARDVVYVVRTSDGGDVFRRYLPRYTRSQVVFFEGGTFGYSSLDGTHILDIPSSLVP